MRASPSTPNGKSAAIDRNQEALRRRLDSLQERLSALKHEALGVDPNNFWLNASELTTWGYRQIAADIWAFTGAALTGNEPSIVATDSRLDTLDWGGGVGFLSFFLEGLGFRNTHYDFASGEPCADLILGRLEGPVVSRPPIRCSFHSPTRRSTP